MKQYGLSRQERISKQREFKKVLDKGIKLHNKVMTLFILNNYSPYSRLGIIVSKKLAQKATQRNRLKRLIREAFRLNKPHLPKGADIVIKLNQIEEISLQEISDNLVKLCQLSGIS